MNTQKQIFLIVVLFFTFVGGCSAYAVFDIPHRADMQADHLQEQSVERGALLFANNCRTCHGISGEGIIGPQLNTDDFKNQDPLILSQTRAMLDHTISCGRAGTQMPAWLNTNGGALSEEQINHLVDFLTAPVDPSVQDADGNPTSEGWELALEYGHNLNRGATVQVSGDTLETVAQAHHIGYDEVSAANNNVPIDQILPQDSTIHIPGFSLRPDGYTYHVYNNNETIRKITDSQFVGAAMLADLNKIPYSFSTNKDETVNFSVLGDDGNPVPGLFPGTSIKLTEGAAYVVVSGDTLDSIAKANGVSVDDIASLNPQLAGTDASDEIPSQSYLKLPKGVTYTVQPGDAADAVAKLHGMDTSDDLLSANNLTADSALVPGSKLTIPGDNPEYAIQRGDTIASIAALHNISADDLAQLNDLKTSDAIAPEVDLKMPPIDNYVITGQTIDDIAKGFSGTPGSDFAKTNGIPENAILRVGQSLQVPLDSAGTAPPGTTNDGTACVQYAVPDNIYKSIPGVSTPEATVTAPADVSTQVEVDAHQNDWTVIADGTQQDANKGVVTIAAGTTVTFDNKEGLHTITVNGKMDGENFKQGETRTITFNDPGQYNITCDFHPAMLADIFVQ